MSYTAKQVATYAAAYNEADKKTAYATRLQLAADEATKRKWTVDDLKAKGEGHAFFNDVCEALFGHTRRQKVNDLALGANPDVRKGLKPVLKMVDKHFDGAATRTATRGAWNARSNAQDWVVRLLKPKGDAKPLSLKKIEEEFVAETRKRKPKAKTDSSTSKTLPQRRTDAAKRVSSAFKGYYTDESCDWLEKQVMELLKKKEVVDRLTKKK